MNSKQMTFEFNNRPTIKGYPELRWTGKCPYKATQYFPAQLQKRYGEEQNGWINKIFRGDNLQIMSHLLKDYRGKVDLIYIDPPFDRITGYKKTIKNGDDGGNDTSLIEKQQSDICPNDEYLQSMYERLILLRELLSSAGTIIVHLDYHKCYYIRLVMDEVFGQENFRNELIWTYDSATHVSKDFPRKHDNLLRYVKNSKNSDWTFNTEYRPYSDQSVEQMKKVHKSETMDLKRGTPVTDCWTDIKVPVGLAKQERTGYSTQKPEALLERIIKVCSNPGDLVFDCFMGSGTTQAVAMKLGRRFIGADINLDAIQTTTKRLLAVADEMQPGRQMELTDSDSGMIKYTGFEVYEVSDYDFSEMK